MERKINGVTFPIQNKWLRVTQNPETIGEYPRSGDVIIIQDCPYCVLHGGEYLVVMVTKYEPPFAPDKRGEDIRISLTDGFYSYPELNGERLLKRTKSINGQQLPATI